MGVFSHHDSLLCVVLLVGHAGCFQFGASTRDTAVSISVHVL